MTIKSCEQPGNKIIFLHSHDIESSKELAVDKLKSLGLDYGEPAVITYYSNIDNVIETKLLFGIGYGDNQVFILDDNDSLEEINSRLNALSRKVGDLSNLTTEDKSSLVNAINELKKYQSEPDRLTEGTGISIDDLRDGRRKISVNVSPNRNNILRTDEYGDLIVDRLEVVDRLDVYTKEETDLKIDEKLSPVKSDLTSLTSKVSVIDGQYSGYRLADKELKEEILTNVSDTVDNNIADAIIDGGEF